MKPQENRDPSRRQGAVLMEFVIAFPVVLVMILGCVQIAHIWAARLVVNYAAFCAARSALTCHKSEYDTTARWAAEEVCKWIVIGEAAGEQQRGLPGWGTVPGSGATRRKVADVKIEETPNYNVKATVEFHFALVTPIVGPMIAWGVDPWSASDPWAETRSDATGNAHRFKDTVQYPHIVLKETVALPKPYITVTQTK